MTDTAAAEENSAPFSLKPLVFQAFACTMAMMAFTSLVGPIGRSIGLEAWQMGVAVTMSGIAWMLTARPWGRASDRLGRRRVMLAGLGLFGLSYAALCLFTAWALQGGVSVVAAFAGLIVLRGLSGAVYSAVPPTATALIADHLTPENRAGAIATVGMANGASMVLGPAVVGLIAPFSLVAPLYLIAFLPLAAFAGLWWALPRIEAAGPEHAAPPPRLGDSRLRRPVAVAFGSMFAVSAAQVVVGFFAIDRLDLSPSEGGQVAGIALTCVGVALTLAQMAVRRSALALDTLARIGLALAAGGFSAAAFAVTPVMLYGCYFLAATGMGLVWPSVSAMAANAVDRNEQGAAAGTVTAAQGMGTVLGPLVGTTVYDLHFSAPYIVIGLVLAVLSLGAWRSGTQKNPMKF